MGMNTTEIVVSSPVLSLFNQAIDTYLSGLHSPKTAEAYEARLGEFMNWYIDQPSGRPFIAHLKSYIDFLQEGGLSPRSIQAHLNTVKSMIRTAAVLEPALAVALPQLDLAKPPVVRGQLQGQRLSETQRQALIEEPNHRAARIAAVKGRGPECKRTRDTAILALASVLGLRRSEIAGLSWSHIQELDGHHVIYNLRGKHGRVRTIKLRVDIWRKLRQWADCADLDTSPEAPVFVQIRRGDHVQHGQRITSAAVAFIVEQYTEAIGMEGISPHDLRRTAASISRHGGASIEMVQQMLGHASPQTTSAYIGEELNLDDHAVDYGRVSIPD